MVKCNEIVQLIAPFACQLNRLWFRTESFAPEGRNVNHSNISAVAKS